MIISSVDIALPIGIKRWCSEFYLWHYFRNVGQDMRNVISSIVFFSLQAFLSWLKLNIILIQKIQYTSLFMLTGFSMYFLMNQLYKGKHQRILYLIAVIFYMFNLYLEPVWGGFNVANLSAYISIPFLLGILIKFVDGRPPPFKTFFMTALASLLFASTGVNPPLLMALVVIFGACFSIYFFKELKRKNYLNIKVNLKKMSLFLLVVLLINAFWITPYLGEIFSYSSFQATSAMSGAETWEYGLSYHSGIFNVLRFQCNWAWYGGWNEPYAPYAHLYKDNLFLIAFGWLIPLLVIFGMIFARFKHKYIFVSMTILSLILSMGSHKPFGFIFIFLRKYLPYFWIVRSPWYKFTLLTSIGYAVFLGFAAKKIYEFLMNKKLHFRNYKIQPVFSVVLIAVVIMIYAFPVTFGKVFIGKEERKILTPNYTRVPDYVFSANKWIEDKEKFGRTIVLPSNAPRIYNWDFAYPGPILSQFSTASIIAPSYTDVFSPRGGEIIRQFYRSLYGNFKTDVQKILRIMSIRYLLHEKDIIHNYFGESIESPQFIKQKLSGQENIEFVKTFGAWDIYETRDTLPHIYALPEISLVSGGIQSLFYLSCINDIKANAFFFIEEQTKKINRSIWEIDKFDSIIFFDTDITDIISNYVDESNQFNLSPDAKKINFYVENPGNYILWAHRNPQVQADAKLIMSPARPQIIDLKIDAEKVKAEKIKNNLFNIHQKWVELSKVYLKKGSHSIELSENLGDADRIFIVSEKLYESLKLNLVNRLSEFNNNVHFIYSKDSLATEPLYPDKEGLSFAFVKNLKKENIKEDTYFWMTGNNSEVTVFNPGTEPLKVNIKFTVYSHQDSRNLYIKINGKEIPRYPKILKDTPCEIFLADIILKPGNNSLSFFNYAASANLKNLKVSFGFKDFKTFKFNYKIKIDVPREGNYKFNASPIAEDIYLNNEPFLLASEEPESAEFLRSKEVYFTKGLKKFSFSAFKDIDEDFFFNLSSDKQIKSPSSPGIDAPELWQGESETSPAIKFKMINPVKYRIESKSREPFFLIFNESYHPGWKAYINGRQIAPLHFLINGYANAWYIDAIGQNEIILEYVPQRLFVVGAVISACTLLMLTLAFIVSSVFSRQIATGE